MGESRIPKETGERWRQIALIWARIATVPLTTPDAAMKLFVGLIRDVLGAEHAWVLLVQRTDNEMARRRFGAAGEWIPITTVAHDESIIQPEVDREFTFERAKHDVWTTEVLRGAGTHRTHIREDVLGDAPWSSCETGWHMEQYGVTDRMNSIHSLTPNVEFHIGVNRTEGPDWTQEEKAWLHDVNVGLTPFCARLALSCGVLADHQILSPRERETLLHLLDGESEARIADEMGLAKGTVHQYVVSIFRKLGVNSRSELIRAWLEPGDENDVSKAALERELASTLSPLAGE